MRAGWIVVALAFAGAGVSAGCDTLFGVEPRVDAAAGADAAAGIDAVWPDGPPGDVDGDGVANEDDNCPPVANADQNDEDTDGVGDPCDPCPHRISNGEDFDTDGVGDACDADTSSIDRWDRFAGFSSLTLAPCSNLPAAVGWTCYGDDAGATQLSVEGGAVAFPLTSPAVHLQLRTEMRSTSVARLLTRVTVSDEDLAAAAHVRLGAHLSLDDGAGPEGYVTCSIERGPNGSIVLRASVAHGGQVVATNPNLTAGTRLVGSHTLVLDLSRTGMHCELDDTTVDLVFPGSIETVRSLVAPGMIWIRAVEAQVHYLGIITG